MTYNIYNKALDIFKERENYYGDRAHTHTSYTTTQCDLSIAATYATAWTILYHAMHEDWDAIEKFVLKKEEENE